MDILSVGRQNLFNVPQTMTPSMMQPQGMVVRPNIDLGMQPRIPNEDGSISSVRSMSFNDGNGREVLIPTVSQNGRLLSIAESIQQYRATGKHLGIFATPAHADSYANALHLDYANGKIRGHAEAPSMAVGPVNVQGGNSLDWYNH